MSSQVLAQLYSPSLELIMLIIAVVIDAFLAVVVYKSNRNSATNIVFSMLAIATAAWLVLTYVSRIPELLNVSIWLHRLGIVVAVPHSFLFFLLAHTMPAEKIRLTKVILYGILGWCGVVMCLNISPLAFTGITTATGTSQPVAGPGIAPFTLTAVSFSALAVYWLVRKYLSSNGDAKQQFKLVLIGILVMLTSIILTIMVPIAVFNAEPLLSLAPLFTLAFLGSTAYAITKYRLFDMKVLLAEMLTLVMCLILFAKLFGEESVEARVVDALALAAMIGFGFFLVRSVKREVQQREIIQAQEQELEQINAQQESLLHFISHEIKGYLTKGQNAFAGIIEGDYGDAPPKVKALATGALHEMRKGVSTVMDILDASNYKKGTMSYDKKPFDIKKAILEMSDEMRFMAEEKGLRFEVQIAPTGQFMLVGDEPKLRRHVLRNLIENSIRYTLKGKVTVSLAKVPGYIRLTVSDTGVGITPEDKKRLFTQGGRGKDSVKVNVDSTGYGLYVAKQVVTEHKGKIEAHSEGAGKGSIFTVDLPSGAN